ncbi:hypothetical protein H3M14_08640 [Latilactobacillus sakei]|uniref:hypothetical protein n=1 Tax=Latilactobacillus sakei TaxID=1599 RepID=UPI0015F41EE9|nr:hypothetical protein [Latilactobacillus sakei]QMU86143.1 hypothetical protein H3M14_08640 [Latilactobacillus sakei]
MKLIVTDLTEKDRKEITDTINQAGVGAFDREHSIFHDGYARFDDHYERVSLYEGMLTDKFGDRMKIIAKRLRQDNLNPDYWYLFEEPLDGLMRVVCPFIGKEVSFVFDSEETNLKSKQHDPLSLIGLDYSGLPFGELETTQDLIEAILLDQSSLY